MHSTTLSHTSRVPEHPILSAEEVDKPRDPAYVIDSLLGWKAKLIYTSREHYPDGGDALGVNTPNDPNSTQPSGVKKRLQSYRRRMDNVFGLTLMGLPDYLRHLIPEEAAGWAGQVHLKGVGTAWEKQKLGGIDQLGKEHEDPDRLESRFAETDRKPSTLASPTDAEVKTPLALDQDIERINVSYSEMDAGLPHTKDVAEMKPIMHVEGTLKVPTDEAPQIFPDANAFQVVKHSPAVGIASGSAPGPVPLRSDPPIRKRRGWDNATVSRVMREQVPRRLLNTAGAATSVVPGLTTAENLALSTGPLEVRTNATSSATANSGHLETGRNKFVDVSNAPTVGLLTFPGFPANDNAGSTVDAPHSAKRGSFILPPRPTSVHSPIRKNKGISAVDFPRSGNHGRLLLLDKPSTPASAPAGNDKAATKTDVSRPSNGDSPNLAAANGCINANLP